MAGTVHLSKVGRVAVLSIDHPPVNALSHAVRSGLQARVEEAGADDRIGAVVIVGAGETFPAGADIREFGKPIAAPMLNAVIGTIEASAKPVIAAIHGTAFGGGLELAMGCHGRIASPSAKMALPEVTLGVMPGAGGTQRLPRLVGLEKALDMIVTGRAIDARDALRAGLVDALAEGDLVAAALAMAEASVDAPSRPVLARDRSDKLSSADPGLFDLFERLIDRRYSGQVAPREVLKSVRNVLNTAFDEALRLEREGVAACLASPQTLALQYAFFAERAARKIDDLPAGIAAREVRSVGLAGCGPLARGIAIACADAGLRVCLWDEDARAVRAAAESLREEYGRAVTGGRVSDAEAQARLARVTVVDTLCGLATVDLVIEAVAEDLASKARLVQALDQIGGEAVLATSTPFLDVNEIARFSRRPETLVGLHFFLPAHVVRQVEIVRGAATAPEVVATAVAFCRALGKTAVVIRDCDGFVGDRMLRAYLDEAFALAEEGVPRREVDRALRSFGMSFGPFELCDYLGAGLAQRIRDGRRGGGDPVSPRGTGSPASDGALTIADDVVVMRCLSRAVDEGVRLIEEGVVQRPSDIDVVWLNGLGFPRHCGGPLYWADTVGLTTVLQTLERISERRAPASSGPAALLVRRAAEGGRIREAL